MQTSNSPTKITLAAFESELQQADLAYKNGDLQHAESLCESILAKAPNFPPALHLAGRIARKGGDIERAIELFSRVVSLDLNANSVRIELGTLLRRTGRIAEAATLFELTVKARPNDPKVLNELGLCYSANRNFEGAESCFRRALAIQPDFAGCEGNLGKVLERAGRPQEAIVSYQHAIEGANRKDLNPPSLHIRLGRALHASDRREEADERFGYAADIAEDTSTLETLANTLADAGEWVKAETVAKRAIALDPKAASPKHLLGRILKQLGRFDEAFAACIEAADLDPTSGAAYLGAASARKFSEADEDLLHEMTKATELKLPLSQRRNIHFALGKVHNDLKNYELAIQHFDSANAIGFEELRLAGRLMDRERSAADTDRIIATFTREFLDRHPKVGSSDEVPVLIVGMIRSGTTLTEQILSSHPEIGGGGELRFWMRTWKSLNLLSRGMLDRAAAAKIYDEYSWTLRDLAPGMARVTDKMPLNYPMLGLVHLVFPRARIIHCRRHPVDTCLSIYASPVSPEFAHDRSAIVFYYQQYLKFMEHWRHVLPKGNFFEVDYEELVANREPVTRAMIEFCGLEWNDACLAHEKNKRAVSTPSVWQVRQPMYSSSAGRWRNYEPWLREFRELLPAQ